MLKSFFYNNKIEAGCDEVGRGCLSGPVVAAAVILHPEFKNSLLKDSKKLSENQRITLKKIIEEEALAWAVGVCDNLEIDKLNILNASFEAMHRAINSLSVEPELLLIDGNRFNPYQAIPHKCIIKGDNIYASIAAASVLAKTFRDSYMLQLHQQYPEYNWKKNKGYPTVEHRQALGKHGITPFHRKSFSLMPKQMQINFYE